MRIRIPNIDSMYVGGTVHCAYSSEQLICRGGQEFWENLPAAQPSQPEHGGRPLMSVIVIMHCISLYSFRN